MVYLPRTVDVELDELLPGLAAIAIKGPKGVGKTETARRRARSILALDDPSVRELVGADPDLVTRTRPPLLIDEWQRLPQVWDVVRRAVDEGAAPGRFLLTGSATPSEGTVVHSGAGHIVQLRMRPLCVAERRLTPSTVSLGSLLAGYRPDVSGDSPLLLSDYVEEILASGFPAIRTLTGRPRRVQLEGYLQRIVDHDFPEQGQRVRRPSTLRAWLTAYAAATATTASHAKIIAAASTSDRPPAKTTTISYRDVLAQLWLLDPIPGWTPSRNWFTRLKESPKHHLADPALAAALLGATAQSLLAGDDSAWEVRDGTLLGGLFESLAALTVQVAAQASEASVAHLRTRNGDHEVDFIVERPDHKVLAIEVKLAATVSDRDVTHLRWLASTIGEDLIDSIVITTGRHAYRRPDGIAVVPLALLGA